MAKKNRRMAGVTCLGLGRALSRVECGLAYSANAILEGKATGVSQGLFTVFKDMGHVHQMLGRNKIASGITAKANFISRTLELKKKIPASKSKEILEEIRKMKGDLDRLFQASASVCSGKK